MDDSIQIAATVIAFQLCLLELSYFLVGKPCVDFLLGPCLSTSVLPEAKQYFTLLWGPISLS